MKQIVLIVLLMSYLFTPGCAGWQTGKPLTEITQTMDAYVEILARDWPKASAAIREGVGTEFLPKNISDQMDRIDKLMQHEDGKWFNADEIAALDDYTKWSAAFARLRHVGPVMKAIIQTYSPGLLAIPEVMMVLTFIGLGAL